MGLYISKCCLECFADDPEEGIAQVENLASGISDQTSVSDNPAAAASELLSVKAFVTETNQMTASAVARSQAVLRRRQHRLSKKYADFIQRPGMQLVFHGVIEQIEKEHQNQQVIHMNNFMASGKVHSTAVMQRSVCNFSVKQNEAICMVRGRSNPQVLKLFVNRAVKNRFTVRLMSGVGHCNTLQNILGNKQVRRST